MKKLVKTVEELLRDEVLLVSVRKIHNDATKTRDGKNFKVQLEGAEFIDNPYRPFNLQSFLNQGDTRFAGQSPRRGWTTAEPSMWDKVFGEQLGVSSKEIEALDFSSTSQGDIDSPMNKIEGKHFIRLGILNPVITANGVQYPLHVQVIESTLQRNKFQRAKINPSDGLVQTYKGSPIFTLNQLTFGKMKSEFLVSDQMMEAHTAGTLSLPQAALDKYGADVPEIRAISTATKKELADLT